MLTKKRVVGATALVVVAAAIGTVPAIAGEEPGKTAVGPAVSWTSDDGAGYISDYSNPPKSRKWRREHRHSTANWPGRWQDEVNPDAKTSPSIPPPVGTETAPAGTQTGTLSAATYPTSTGSTETMTAGPTPTETPTAPENTETATAPAYPTTTSEPAYPTSTTDPGPTGTTTGTTTGPADPTPTAPGTGLPGTTTPGAGVSSSPVGCPTTGVTTTPTGPPSASGTLSPSPTETVTPTAATPTALAPTTQAPMTQTPTADAAVTPTDTMTPMDRTDGTGTTEGATGSTTDGAMSSESVLRAAAGSDGDEMTPCSTKNRSGLPWGASGLYMPGSSAANTEQFAAWRGRPVDVVVDWPARQSWDDIINPTWIFDAWKGTPYMKALGVAPIPEADGSATLAGCAAGQYNDKWVQFGKNFVANDMGDSIIRLGWEFNGDWYKWSARNPAEFAGCWRQIVTTVRTVAPDLKWDWTVNRGVSAGLADATQAYPGDEYVDIVGIDSYDMWPGANNDQTWEEQYGGNFGLKYWADFATQHGKKLSVPEWGCYPGSAQAGHNGGDNALYINKMVDFFKSMGSNLAYESYFNEDASYYAGAIFQPNQNPNAAGEYQKRLANP